MRSSLFLFLPDELQLHIIIALPIADILNFRLVCRTLYTLVALNGSIIARYHAKHSLPSYTLQLYPSPHPTDISFHHLCCIWHRCLVVTKLATNLATYATKEIFLRTTEAQLLDFEPQYRRMRRRLVPIIFAIFHFFEKYRDLHVS